MRRALKFGNADAIVKGPSVIMGKAEMDKIYLNLLNYLDTMHEIAENLDNLVAKGIIELTLAEVYKNAAALSDMG